MKAWLISTVCVLASVPGAVGIANADATDASSETLDTIVITAQKRSENLQDVPIKVTAVTAEMLENMGIRTTQDLQFVVPGLEFNSILGIGQVFLRGIGTDVSTPNSDPSVATYVDGAVVASIVDSVSNLLGVERTEVVAGPQGTLYGRNAVGGAINIITLTPSQKPEVEGSVTYGNYNRQEGSVHASGGLTDSLAVGVYAAVSDRNSYFDHAGPNPSGYADGLFVTQDPRSRSWGVRIKAVWDPVDWLKLTASAEKTHDTGSESMDFREIAPNAVSFVALGAPLLIQRYTTAGNDPNFRRVDQENFLLREEVDLGWANVLGISDYRSTVNPSGTDFDTTPVPLIAVGDRIDEHQWSQELQLLSKEASSVKWIAGLYEFFDKSGYDPLFSSSGGIAFPPPMDISYSSAVADSQSSAIFGQATVPVTPIAEGLRVTVGGRYTVDKKTFLGGSQVSLTQDFATAFPTVDYPGGQSKTWKEFTPKFGVDYRLDETLLYATYSKGFKSGTFNLSVPAAPGPVNPETLIAYEIGSKSDFLGNRLRIDTSVYDYNFKNRQEQIQEPASVILLNAANAKAWGAELTVEGVVTNGLKLNAALAYEHSWYSSFPDSAGFVPGAVGNTAVVIDATGDQLQRAPSFTASLGAKYDFGFTRFGKIDANLGWYHNSGFYWEPGSVYRQSAYSLLNGSLNFTTLDDHWQASLWGTNLTNTFYEMIVDPVAFGTEAVDAPPRMYGITLKYRWR